MAFVDVGTVALSVPVMCLLGAVAALVARRNVAASWQVAHGVVTVTLVVSALAAAWRGWELVAGIGAAPRTPDAWVAVDLLAFAMLGLITTLGWVIVRFSRGYLQGEPAQPRYIAALLTTLACASLVALSNHLALLAIGWMATSLSLHRLLTYYPDRPWALIAAHKKFLVSRLAEVCLASVLLLIGLELGTLSIPAIASAVREPATLPLTLQAAAVLLAMAVVLKSAQLPVHGWLIQVMEAPTPVSALLHAGVVNLGGFVLIRMAPLMSAVPAAQALLVVVGGITAVVAALVMTTRISVKVKLAWSTCAQMGFMLVECGLGLYELALLHILAHSVYKAHAFLAAAGTVADTRLRRLAPLAMVSSAPRQWGGAVVAVALVAGSAWAWSQVSPAAQFPWALVGIAGIGLAPVASGVRGGRLMDLWRTAAPAVALAQLPVLWHLLLATAHLGAPRPASSVLLSWTAVCGVVLFVVQSHVAAGPRSRLARQLYRWCYAGLYLDERFTRWTFRAWPLRLPATSGVPPVPSTVLAATGGAL